MFGEKRRFGVFDGSVQQTDQRAGDGGGVATIDHLEDNCLQRPEDLSPIRQLHDSWVQPHRNEDLEIKTKKELVGQE